MNNTPETKKTFIPPEAKAAIDEAKAREKVFQKTMEEVEESEAKRTKDITALEKEKKENWLATSIASAKDKVMSFFVKSPEELKAKGRQEIKRNKFKNEAYQNLLKTEPEKAEKYLIAAGKYQTIKWSAEKNDYVDASSYHYS